MSLGMSWQPYLEGGESSVELELVLHRTIIDQPGNNHESPKVLVLTMGSPKTKGIVVGISGASSSGKTTLSRLLRDIFPNTYILHEDDFYKAELDLPRKDGLLDWDCAESLSIPEMSKVLDHIKKCGTKPTDFDSKEDHNDVGKCPVPDAVISELKDLVAKWTQSGEPGHLILEQNPDPFRLCIFDGFLLYSSSLAAIQPYMDIKFFLRVSYARAKARREARSGYVTIEGFWEDPPGYVDKIVWPNYVADHAFMFEEGDVEGRVDTEVLKQRGILCLSNHSPDVDMATMLKWLVESIMQELEAMFQKA